MAPQVSVVVPALDEEGNLAGAVENVMQALATLGVAGEVVVVNDGSTDGTPDVLRQLQALYPALRVIHHERPMGLGRSFWEGVKIARGESVTLTPGDGENDAYEILRHLPLMEDVDLVVPFVVNREVRGWKRRVLSHVYRDFVNLSFGTRLKYTNGTVLYRRSVLEDVTLRSQGFFYQTELLVKCLRSGCSYVEVPCELKGRAKGGSKALTMKALTRLACEYAITVAETRLT